MKNRTLFTLALASLVAFAGCTAPTQRIAADAIQRGVNQEHSIVQDLSTMAKQSAVDTGVASARVAAASGNADGAQAAVEKVANDFEKVGWLQIQHERARNMIRFGQMYVWSQQGIFDLMVKDLKTAKQNADANKAPVADTEPK